jgi:hypothetical protein
MATVANAKTMHGARAILSIQGIFGTAIDSAQTAEKVTKVGIFSDVHYSVAYQAEPVYILGRYSPAEIVYTAMDMVRVSCSGWRVIGNDVNTVAGFPKLQDLLKNTSDLTLTIYDRQSGKQVATIKQCKPVSYRTSSTSKTLQTITVDFVGLIVDEDEQSVKNAEDASAMDLSPTIVAATVVKK